MASATWIAERGMGPKPASRTVDPEAIAGLAAKTGIDPIAVGRTVESCRGGVAGELFSLLALASVL